MRKLFIPLICNLGLQSLSAQEVIMSGETMYHSNFGIINNSIRDHNVGEAKKSNTAKKAPFSSLRFNRSESLSQQIQREYMERLKDEQQSKSKYKKLFTDNQLRTEFDQLLARYGFSSTNLGDVIAV